MLLGDQLFQAGQNLPADTRSAPLAAKWGKNKDIKIITSDSEVTFCFVYLF